VKVSAVPRHLSLRFFALWMHAPSLSLMRPHLSSRDFCRQRRHGQQLRHRRRSPGRVLLFRPPRPMFYSLCITVSNSPTPARYCYTILRLVPGVLEPTVSRPSPSTTAPAGSVSVAATSTRKPSFRRARRAQPRLFLRPKVSPAAFRTARVSCACVSRRVREENGMHRWI
jgi:hypothetical protein